MKHSENKRNVVCLSLVIASFAMANVQGAWNDVDVKVKSLLPPKEVRLDCKEPNGWRFDLATTSPETGVEVVRVVAKYRKALGYSGTIERMERFAFYERAKKAYAVVVSGETAKYGNIILKKGVTPAFGD